MMTPEQIEDLAQRIEELESQATFQDELHQRLNDIVARQDREILDLKRLVRELSERVAEAGDSAAGGEPADEVPPHY